MAKSVLNFKLIVTSFKFGQAWYWSGYFLSLSGFGWRLDAFDQAMQYFTDFQCTCINVFKFMLGDVFKSKAR
jgi:hypothetical protein